jgi:tRNA pseudouridine38-40 synthase
LTIDFHDPIAIEGDLEKALFEAGMILDTNYGHLEKIGWSRSSRTDKGVHSLSTVFGVRLEGMWTRMIKGLGEFEYDIEEDCLPLADLINKHLPAEIKVLAVAPVVQHWDARKACIHRHYEYLVPIHVLDNSIYHSDRQAFTRMLNLYQGRHHWHNFGQIERRRPFSSNKRHTPHTEGSEGTHEPLSTTTIEREPNQPQHKASAADSQVEPSLLNVAPSSYHPAPQRPSLFGIDQFRLEDDRTLKQELSTRERREHSATYKQAAIFNSPEQVASPPPQEVSNVVTMDGSIEPSEFGVPQRKQPLSQMTPKEIAELPMDGHLSQDAFFRTISHVSHDEVEVMGERYVRISLQGDSFLLHQVRRMIGALIIAAKGVISEEALLAAIDSPFRLLTPRAPPQGLLLRDANFLELDFKGRDVEPAKTFARQYVYPHLHRRWTAIGTSEEVGEELEDDLSDDNSIITGTSTSASKDPWAELAASQPIHEVRDIIPNFDEWLQWHIHDTKERELKRVQRKAYYAENAGSRGSRGRDQPHRVTTRTSF